LKKKDIVFIKHINDSIYLILEYIKGLDLKKFNSKQIVQDAVIRRIGIIGEAVKNLSMEFREKYSEPPWKQITGLRDKVVHGYFRVDTDRIWLVITKDIPVLKDQIREIIKKEE